jgi:hypothetical protein
MLLQLDWLSYLAPVTKCLSYAFMFLGDPIHLSVVTVSTFFLLECPIPA